MRFRTTRKASSGQQHDVVDGYERALISQPDAAKRFWSTLRHSLFSRCRDDKDWLHVFGTNARLQSPIHAIATDVASVKFRLVRVRKRRGMDPEKTQVHEHPFLELLKQPYPGIFGRQFVWLVQVYLDLVGKAPIWMTRNSRGRPTRLTPFPPHWITRLPDAENLFFDVVWGDGRLFKIPAGDIIWLYRPDPLNPYGDGLGLAKALDDEVNQDEAMSKFNNYYFRHSAFLGAIVSVPGCDPDEMAAEWRQTREGVANSHRTMFIDSAPGQVSVTNMTPAMKDLNFQGGREQARDFMIQPWGMPPERLGVLKNSNRSTIHEADFLSQSKIVVPRADFWVDSLNAFVLPLYGDSSLCLEYENPVKESLEQTIEKIDTGVARGIVTMNEGRQQLGFPPVKGGNVFLIPTNNVVAVPADGDIASALIAAMQQLQGGQSDGG